MSDCWSQINAERCSLFFFFFGVGVWHIAYSFKCDLTWLTWVLQAGLGSAVASVFLSAAYFGENLETSTIQNSVNDTAQPPEDFTAQFVSEVSLAGSGEACARGLLCCLHDMLSSGRIVVPSATVLMEDQHEELCSSICF